MAEESLFPGPECPLVSNEQSGPWGSPRIQYAVRNQVELIMTDLDRLVAEDDQVRIVWAFVEQQDLSALYALVTARGCAPGRPPIDPRIVVALWLNATLDGVGSGRELDRRCEEQVGYQWICGGVSVNYHTLSDFRVAQDGMRVRASAGSPRTAGTGAQGGRA